MLFRSLGDPAAVPALAQTLRAHDEPLVRGHAAWALGRIGGGEARVALGAALREERDDGVIQEIRCAREMLSGPTLLSRPARSPRG